MKQKFSTFYNANKVFILGLIAAISVVLQQFIDSPEADFKVIAFAVAMAVLSYFAKEWRGQGLSITGIVGNLAYVLMTGLSGGDFSWNQLLLQAIVAIIAAAGPDPKSRGYEQSPNIVKAKAQGEEINPALLTKKP